VCVDSHCAEHPWRLRSEVFIPGKKSVFALTQKHAEEEQDQEFDDDDDDDDGSDDAVDETVTDEHHDQLPQSHDVHTALQPVHADVVHDNTPL